MKTLVALVSGRGSNLQAILDASLPLRVSAVLSNDSQAQALARARAAGIPTAVIDHRNFSERMAFEHRLAEAIDCFAPDFIALAGFMRVLGDAFVQRYAGRMVNIHPSLLPAFPGLHTHRRALEAGVRIHGCTVHFVTPALDMGPIIVQSAVPVLPGDDEASLGARVLVEEHRIYPQALAWLATGRVALHADRVTYPHDRAEPALIAPALDAATPMARA
ncbi:MAG: phosphoribosylglycinamide formyltransferase [Burkholderiales bacterium]|nr:phosphoribosylglycinamide formyltransferase [Burkholderiales bacterium]